MASPTAASGVPVNTSAPRNDSPMHTMTAPGTDATWDRGHATSAPTHTAADMAKRVGLRSLIPIPSY